MTLQHPAQPPLAIEASTSAVNAAPPAWVRERRSGPRRRFFLPLLAAVIALLALTRGDEIAEVGRTLITLHPIVILSICLLATCGVVNRGSLYRAAMQAVGVDFSAGAATRTTAVAYATNKMIKSGGTAGLAVFVRAGHHRGHGPGPITAGYTLASLSSLAALGTTFAAAIATTWATGELTGVWVAAATGFGIYSAITLAVVATAFTSRTGLRRLFRFGARAKAYVLRRKLTEEARIVVRQRADENADELFEAARHVRRNPGVAAPAFARALIAKVIGVATMWLALAAVGVSGSPLVALTVYVLALGSSLAGILPGGTGAVEATLAGALISGGGAATAVAAAIVIFRITDLWLPVLVGLLAARGLHRSTA